MRIQADSGWPCRLNRARIYGRCNDDVRLYAFDLLSDDGVDMRDETLQIRKLWLGKLLKRSADGILYNDQRGRGDWPSPVRAGLQDGDGRDRLKASGARL